MNASQIARATGFAALLGVSGETLARGSNNPIQGIINRNVKEKHLPAEMKDGKMNFKLDGLSVIEIAFGAVAQPKSGDVYADTIGIYHRIQIVKSTDITWQCYCTVSQRT